MTCTLSKCWSNSLDGVCGGDLQTLEEYSSSPTSHLISISSFHKTGDNPQHMWQVWLSAITASTFSEDEIKNFTVCVIHKARFMFWCTKSANFQFQDFLVQKFAVQKVKNNNKCSVCGSKSGLRNVNYQQHKECYSKFALIVQIGAGNSKNFFLYAQFISIN